jgi:DNA-binding transcriptional ArsR family regulator
MVYRQDRLDAAFGALSHATRRSMLAHLARGDRSISELASNFDMTLPAVSKHIRVLERAGLAVVRQEGRVRLCQLAATPLRDAAIWIDDYRRFWEESFDRLAAFLDETLTEEVPPWQPARPKPTQPQSSKSGARSTRRGPESSPRGRRRKR